MKIMQSTGNGLKHHFYHEGNEGGKTVKQETEKVIFLKK